MAIKPKCPICGLLIEDKTEITKVMKSKNKYYHIECKEEESIKNVKTLDEREELYNYVCELFHIKYPTGMILKQIKTYKEEMGFTYKGMHLSLQYFYETLNNKIIGDGVGIIPYIYEDAKNHYILKRNIQKHTENVEEAFVTTRIVKIKPPKSQPLPHLIENANMEGILNTED